MLTKFQRSHHPINRVEIKCHGQRGSNGLCRECGREIARNEKHNPNATGSLGWIVTYSDGSTAIEQ